MPVYVVLPFYAAADGDGFRVIGVKPLPLPGDAPGQHLIASLEVRTAKLGRDQLLLGAGDRAKGDGSLRPDEVPVLPAAFRTHALAAVITRRSGACTPQPRLPPARQTGNTQPHHPAA